MMQKRMTRKSRSRGAPPAVPDHARPSSRHQTSFDIFFACASRYTAFRVCSSTHRQAHVCRSIRKYIPSCLEGQLRARRTATLMSVRFSE